MIDYSLALRKLSKLILSYVVLFEPKYADADCAFGGINCVRMYLRSVQFDQVPGVFTPVELRAEYRVRDNGQASENLFKVGRGGWPTNR